MEIRQELKLDKPLSEDPDDEETVNPVKTIRDLKTGALVKYYEDNAPPLPKAHDARTPLPGEMSVLQWCKREAAKSGYSVTTIRLRVYTGYYKDRIEVRKAFTHLSFVREKNKAPIVRKPQPDPFNGNFAEGLI